MDSQVQYKRRRYFHKQEPSIKHLLLQGKLQILHSDNGVSVVFGLTYGEKYFLQALLLSSLIWTAGPRLLLL